MRLLLVTSLALAACSHTAPIELATCGGGVEIAAGLEHSMSIDAEGGLAIDGARCRNDGEAHAALDAVMKAMPSNAQLAQRLGFLNVPEAPFAVRIDGDARFADAAWWLAASQHSYRIFRTRLAVRDSDAGAERFLVLDHVLRAEPGCSPLGVDPAWFVGDGTYLMLEANDRPSWSKRIERAPAWEVTRSSVGGDTRTLELLAWSEVRDELERHGTQGCISIRGVLPASTRWREAVPIIAEALERWHADVTFSSVTEPTLGR